MRFWTPIVASLISAIALVATLGVQAYTSNKNDKLQREANEETEWREMLTTVRDLPGKTGPFITGKIRYISVSFVALLRRHIKVASHGGGTGSRPSAARPSGLP